MRSSRPTTAAGTPIGSPPQPSAWSPGPDTSSSSPSGPRSSPRPRPDAPPALPRSSGIEVGARVGQEVDLVAPVATGEADDEVGRAGGAVGRQTVGHLG